MNARQNRQKTPAKTIRSYFLRGSSKKTTESVSAVEKIENNNKPLLTDTERNTDVSKLIEDESETKTNPLVSKSPTNDLEPKREKTNVETEKVVKTLVNIEKKTSISIDSDDDINSVNPGIIKDVTTDDITTAPIDSSLIRSQVTTAFDKDNDIVEVNNKATAYDISSDEEEPVSISLKASKEIILEQRKKQNEIMTSIKNKKKGVQQEREIRNKLQLKKQSLVPEKLDAELLKLVDKEVNINNSDHYVMNKQVANKKIIFEDDEGFDSDFNDKTDDENNEVKPGHNIKVQCIDNVSKNQSINSAQEFMMNHFYNGAIKRKALHGQFDKNQTGKPKSKKF